MSDKPTNFDIGKREGQDFILVPEGSTGAVVWGPYQPLQAGDYEVRFEIHVDSPNMKKASLPCCRLDIATKVGTHVLARKDLTLADVIAQQGRIKLPFSLSENELVEYRVYALRGSAFDVKYFRKAFPAGSPSGSIALESDTLYANNIERINWLEAGGITFDIEDGQLLAHFESLGLEVNNIEDLQLLEEVFVKNDYNILPSSPCIAIDIGMNIGYTSLALARKSSIEAVLSFEPFFAPYQRALVNFKRNASVSGKIQPRNYGLSDRNEELNVKISSTSTIGVSIRGVHTGTPERIKVRDAADELEPIIADAVSRGLGVVMKIDCEGSEFAIFESLARAGLFHHIDAVMVEWHKWWSAEKTQADLIRPLAQAGYVIFDLTLKNNPLTGFFYGVRSGSGNTKAVG